MTAPLKVGIVAGEVSGDILGGSLMAAIRNSHPEVTFYGVGGDQMNAQDLHELADIRQFSVNGFIEPIRRIRPLFQLLRNLRQELSTMDVVVGVDFNVFNLLLEKGVKRKGIPTAHYVSPSVYAWRQGRVKRIGRSTDVVMALFPFETDIYEEHGVRAKFVGHPTADRFDPKKTKAEWILEARSELNLSPDDFVLAVMPGSRRSELKFHFELFLESARRFKHLASMSQFKVLIPSVHEASYDMWESFKSRFSDLEVEITSSPAPQILAASNLALVKSGTSTLEAMLVKTPMVVAYRVGWLTSRIVQAMLHTPFVALPNILANKQLVREYLQDDATVDRLTGALHDLYEEDCNELYLEYQSLHTSLKQGAAENAAATVLSLVGINGEKCSRSG